MKTLSNNDRFQEIKELAIARKQHKEKIFNSNGTYTKQGYKKSLINYNNLMNDNSLKQLMLKITK